MQKKSGKFAYQDIKEGLPALHYAVGLRDTKLVEILLKANPNQVNSQLRSPLYIASGKTPSLEVVKMLVKHGANPNALSSEGLLSPMHAAAESVNKEILEKLIKEGGYIDITGGPENNITLKQVAYSQTKILGFIDDTKQTTQSRKGLAL